MRQNTVPRVLRSRAKLPRLPSWASTVAHLPRHHSSSNFFAVSGNAVKHFRRHRGTGISCVCHWLCQCCYLLCATCFTSFRCGRFVPCNRSTGAHHWQSQWHTLPPTVGKCFTAFRVRASSLWNPRPKSALRSYCRYALPWADMSGPFAAGMSNCSRRYLPLAPVVAISGGVFDCSKRSQVVLS